jgi:hypothetical protein
MRSDTPQEIAMITAGAVTALIMIAFAAVGAWAWLSAG